jgi:hypothetical protein
MILRKATSRLDEIIVRSPVEETEYGHRLRRRRKSFL